MRLVSCDFTEYETDEWHVLAQAQHQAILTSEAQLTPSRFLGRAEKGDVYAMLHTPAPEDWCGIFVCAASDGQVHLFDEDCEPFADQGVVDGSISIEEFVSLWRDGRYALPMLNDKKEWTPSRPLPTEDAEPAAAGSFEAMLTEGTRLKVYMVEANGWFGLLVGPMVEGSCMVGFDDGELRELLVSDFRAKFDANLLLYNEPGEGGVIGSKAGLCAAAGFTMHNAYIVGLLVGDGAGKTGWGANIFFAHFISPSRFPKRRSSKGSATKHERVQDRLGWHTFRNGDTVSWLKAEPADDDVRVGVYGVVYHQAEDGATRGQTDKMLVLYEIGSKIFFLGTWPSYRRCASPPAPPRAPLPLHNRCTAYPLCMHLPFSCTGLRSMVAVTLTATTTTSFAG